MLSVSVYTPLRMTSRRKSRELAFFALYQLDVAGYDPEILIEDTIRLEDISVNARPFFRALIRTTWSQVVLLDALIDEIATGWRVSRMNRLDLALMRIATCELTTPILGELGETSIVINEAVHLAKRYCGEENAKFINGILGRIISLDKPLEMAQEHLSASDSEAVMKRFIPKSLDPLADRQKILHPGGAPKGVKPKPKAIRPKREERPKPEGPGKPFYADGNIPQSRTPEGPGLPYGKDRGPIDAPPSAGPGAPYLSESARADAPPSRGPGAPYLSDAAKADAPPAGGPGEPYYAPGVERPAPRPAGSSGGGRPGGPGRGRPGGGGGRPGGRPGGGGGRTGGGRPGGGGRGPSRGPR